MIKSHLQCLPKPPAVFQNRPVTPSGLERAPRLSFCGINRPLGLDCSLRVSTNVWIEWVLQLTLYRLVGALDFLLPGE